MLKWTTLRSPVEPEYRAAAAAAGLGQGEWIRRTLAAALDQAELGPALVGSGRAPRWDDPHDPAEAADQPPAACLPPLD